MAYINAKDVQAIRKELKENFPLIVGYSKKKFIKNIPMSNSDLFKHCVDSGVSLVRMHLTN